MENRNMEAILQYINKNYVTVADGDIKETNVILSKVLDEITTALRSVSCLFNVLFETYLYGGSFYDGLKVSDPDEFDIDLKLGLPEILDIQLEPTDENGFVFVKLKDWKRFQSDAYLSEIYKDLEKLKDSENYLCQDKVKRWMQGIITQAINKIRENGKLDDIQLENKSVSGPAITLNVIHRRHNMDIDLVAVLRMPGKKWPEPPVRQNENRIWRDFLVVPKSPKDVLINSDRYWRLSFPEQEREMIKGLNFCKPALRLLKKLRDTRKHNIPSYFIKTIFLWEIENRENNRDTAFWNSSLTNVFLYMLKAYKKCLDEHQILYFWDEGNNFLEFISPINVHNIRDYLNGMITKIERNMNEDPYIVARYLLPSDEFQSLQRHFRNVIPEVVQAPHEPTWLREPIARRPTPRQAQPQQTANFPTNLIIGGAAVAIGAAVLGLFAYSRSQRNRND